MRDIDAEITLRAANTKLVKEIKYALSIGRSADYIALVLTAQMVEDDEHVEQWIENIRVLNRCLGNESGQAPGTPSTS